MPSVCGRRGLDTIWRTPPLWGVGSGFPWGHDGASLTLTTQSWNVALYGKNLGDEDGVTGSFPSSHWSYDTGTFENWYGNGNRQYLAQPRTIGLVAKYRF